ncbi:helix-turn-helix transcriptional regulator [Nocardioides sp. GXZ039]|uniref:helix-turn-helix transcriptional regulator n=1 Tax=Nocardioides sp. GXZ039 TaxID=3136018 RepID=UPI0030F41092
MIDVGATRDRIDVAPWWETPAMGLLEPLGVDGLAERVYIDLVEGGPVPQAELATRHADADAAVSDAVEELVARGLVRLRDGAAVALPAAVVLEQQAEEQARAARHSAAMAQELTSWWSRHHSGVGYADFLRSGEACRTAEESIVSGARSEVLSLTSAGASVDEPPSERTPPQELTEAFRASRARGVEFRSCYAQEMLRTPGSRLAVLDRMRAGEQVRVAARVPVSLTIADRQVAVVGYPATRHDEFHSVLVRPSGLLDLLLETFEIFWGLGVALPDRDGAHRDAPGRPAGGIRVEPGTEDRVLLRYLLAGLTDAAIAHELAISTRTVTRRVARLQDQLGVSTRFQLGVQAHERGWV